jgi:hypothetical protein
MTAIGLLPTLTVSACLFFVYTRLQFKASFFKEGDIKFCRLRRNIAKKFYRLDGINDVGSTELPF